MIATKGTIRAAALLLSLMLILSGVSGAQAEVRIHEPAIEIKDAPVPGSSGEMERGTPDEGVIVVPEEIQTAEPAQTATPAPEQTPEHTPSSTPEPTPAPKPEPDHAVVEQAVPKLVEPPKPEPEQEPEAKQYSVSWSSSAFAAQTVNAQDELVIGLGAMYSLDGSNDVQILVNNAKPKSRLKGVSYSYATSNAKYLTVSANGRIKAARRGSAQLFVTVQLPDGNQKQLRKNVKIVDEPKIRFAPDSAVVESGTVIDLSQFAKSPVLMASPNVNAGVTYSISPLGKTTGSRYTLGKGGKLTVRYDRPGDAYVVTAKTYGGEKATFTLYLGQWTQRIEILVSPSAFGEDGRLMVEAGRALPLKAVAYDMTGDLAARQDITWAVIGGGQYAYVDGSGMVTAGKDPGAERTVIVAAMASDGSGASAQVSIIVKP